MSSFEFLFPQQSSDFTRLRNIRGAQLYPFYCFLNTTFETIMVLWCSRSGESIYYYQHLLFTTSERSKMFELEKAWDYRMIFWGQEPNHWDEWFQIPFLRLLFILSFTAWASMFRRVIKDTHQQFLFLWEWITHK